MPYSRQSWDVIGATSRGAATSTFYAYRTADTYAQVRASGYFNDVAGLLRAGDVIFLTTDTGGVISNSMIEVASVVAGVVTTRGARLGAAAAMPVLGGRITLTPLAQANTDFTLAIPTGITVLRATTITTTAYTGTTVTLQLGSTAGGTELVAAVSVKAAGTVAHTLVAPVVGFGTGTLFARLVQTGATNVGAGVCVIEYLDV